MMMFVGSVSAQALGSVLAPVLAMSTPPDGGSAWLQLVPFVLVLGIFYFIILLPMRRKQQKVDEFLEALKVGDRIITTGGIYGRVTRLGEQSVQVEIADKIKIEVAKASIGGYQGQAPVVEPANT
jgi:preprotein translocase subunit YajC